MEMKSFQGQTGEQMPLYVDHKNEVLNLAQELSEGGIISGGNYLKLISYGMERGLATREIDDILHKLNIEIKSKVKPRGVSVNASLH